MRDSRRALSRGLEVTPLDARFETEALELLPYETEQLFRAADIRHDADDDEEEA